MLVATMALCSLISVNPFGAPAPDHPGATPQIAAPQTIPPSSSEAEKPRVAIAPLAPAETPVLPPVMGTQERMSTEERMPVARAPDVQIAGLPPIIMPPAPHLSIPVSPADPKTAKELGFADPPDGYLEEKSRVALLAQPPQIAAVVIQTPEPETQRPSSEPKVAALPAPSKAIEVEQELGFDRKLVQAAHQLTKIPGGYDPKYMKIAYPMGDVPEGMGVCTDVIVRAYRGLGVDLQQLVHHSRLGTGDTNVDHRRVQVLIKFFAKHGENIPVSPFPESYKPGDIVAYDVPWGRTSKWHIAIVTDQLSPSLRPMVVHNRGYGAKLEDALFHKRIIGHYRLDAQGLMVLQHKLLPAQAPALSPGTVTGTKPERRVLARVTIPRI
jgi:uncharacterized protein YijF (DUF1287 family)